MFFFINKVQNIIHIESCLTGKRWSINPGKLIQREWRLNPSQWTECLSSRFSSAMLHLGQNEKWNIQSYFLDFALNSLLICMYSTPMFVIGLRMMYFFTTRSAIVYMIEQQNVKKRNNQNSFGPEFYIIECFLLSNVLVSLAESKTTDQWAQL